MSSSIWTRCAGASEIRPLRTVAWRVVESQHEVSTRKLVRSAAEQELLEQLLENVKPPLPNAAKVSATQHYLLTTPFRYPPLRHGSRFGARAERGLWYGSERQQTAFAEVAYYRLRFLAGTRAALAPLLTPLTSFTVRMRTAQGIDLTEPPFAAFEPRICAPHTYAHSQPLGRAMRDAHVELFRFTSARDADGGTNLAAFTPAVFGRATPQAIERWHCSATPDVVDFTRSGAARARTTLLFPRAQFLVDGVLSAPSEAA
jgi:hypothetical protein